MTLSLPNQSPEKPRRFPWAALVFTASILVIPISYGVIASHSGDNHFGQGLEGSPLRLMFWLVQALSLFGFLYVPCLNSEPQTHNRKRMLREVGVATFLVVQFLSFAFIAFGMFPD